jgi:hypothetical protein
MKNSVNLVAKRCQSVGNLRHGEASSTLSRWTGRRNRTHEYDAVKLLCTFNEGGLVDKTVTQSQHAQKVITQSNDVDEFNANC